MATTDGIEMKKCPKCMGKKYRFFTMKICDTCEGTGEVPAEQTTEEATNG